MRIGKIRIENFRGFSEADVILDGKSAVIYGVNGMGKSTLLDVCNILFSRILQAASNDEQIRPIMLTEEDVKIGENATKITVWFKVDGQTFHYYRSRVDGENRHSENLLKPTADYIRKHYIGSLKKEKQSDIDENEAVRIRFIENEANIPIYLFYGVNRYHESVRRTLRRYTGTKGKLDAWRDSAFGGDINFQLFFEWFRGRQEYENSIRVMDSEAVDFQLEAVRKAILEALGTDFSMIRVRVTEENAELTVVKKGQELAFYQLSEGEKSVIALVGDMARRLSIANPKSTNPLLGEGIVLIDEIDLHLHPSWQAKIFPILQKVFPNIQFIISTHAPKVLESVEGEVQIIRLYEDEGQIQAEQMEPMNGWDVNTILEDYMDTSPLNEKTARLILNLKENIKQENFEKAEELVDQLADMTNEMNPEVVRGRILIAKGR